jgi:hypothetical protein
VPKGIDGGTGAGDGSRSGFVRSVLIDDQAGYHERTTNRMDVEDFKRTTEDLFGHGWQTRLARALGIDPSTVRRWVGATVPVPPSVEAFLKVVAERQEARGALAFERLRLGTPVRTIVPEHAVLTWMEQRFHFPGVDQAKPLPAIASHRQGDALHVSLDGAPSDRIGDETVSYALVRHPDSVHHAAFIAAAAEAGHSVTSVTHRFHHYDVIAHDDGERRLLRRIHTHSGDVRTLTAATSEPKSVDVA